MKMKTLGAVVAVSASGLLVAFLLTPPRANAQAPSAYPSAGAHAPAMSAATVFTPAPSASASASPLSATALPASTFDLPSLSAAPFTGADSDPPTADEWKTAPLVEVARRSPEARACKTRRVREYIRIRCDLQSSGARVVAGNPKGVQINLVMAPTAEPTSPAMAIEVTLPLRRKDPRLIQLFGVESQYEGGLVPVSSRLIDASWPESAAAPTVVIR